MRFDLTYNYYFPFYTMEKRGTKKYYYIEIIYMHISDNISLVFKLIYRKGKLSEINFNKSTNKEYNFYSKEVIHLSYVEFAKKVTTFQNFLNKSLKSLSGSIPYHKIQVFYEVYIFNTEYELTFDFSKISLKKDSFNHQIIDEKKVKPKTEKVSISEEWDKVDKFLDAWESNITYKEISNEKFKKELNEIFMRFNPYLSAPKKIYKKEYKI